MCPPACHLTSYEERELRVLVLDVSKDAAELGHAEFSFHRIRIKARRLSIGALPFQQSDHWSEVPLELLITRDREILSHTIGAMQDLS